MLTGNPFDDLRSLIEELPPIDGSAAKKIMDQLEKKPLSSTAGLVNQLEWLAGWQGNASPAVAEAHICLFASSYHGFGDPSGVTAFVDASAKGAAPVNLLCVDKGIGLRAIQLAPELPHEAGETWKEADCMAAVAFGMEATAAGGDLLALSDVTLGGAVHAMAVISEVLPQMVDDAVMPPDHAGWMKARELASKIAGEGAGDTLEILRVLGGREIAACAGALVAARSRRLPVIIEGWAALAAVCVLEALKPGACQHVQIACAEDDLYRSVAHIIGKKPLVGVDAPAGPGSGAALAVSVLHAACAMLSVKDSVSAQA